MKRLIEYFVKMEKFQRKYYTKIDHTARLIVRCWIKSNLENVAV